MKILITGGSGLVGSRLSSFLKKQGHEIRILSRSNRNHDHYKYFKWDTANHEMDVSALDNVDAVINLAGAGIADKRWTKERKKVILDSRVDSAKTLYKHMQNLPSKPIYIGASAIGYYGDRGKQELVENDKPGKGFLSDVTKKWEESQEPISTLSQRFILLRIGIVLSTKGGALKEMIKPSKVGMYGYFGNGSAYYSWIHIDDLCKMIIDALHNEEINGTYNATATSPVTIKELTSALKQAKGGFGILMPTPEIGLRVALGEMSTMLLNSTRVIPEKFLSQGFEFDFEDPVVAIKDLLENNV